MRTITVTMPGCGCEVAVEAHIAEGTHISNDPHRSEAFVEYVELPERSLGGRLYPACPECGREVGADEVVALCQQAFAWQEVSHD